MPTNGEAGDINRLLDYILGLARNGRAVPTSEQARDAAVNLAQRSYKQLMAGLTGDEVQRLWDERQPQPASRPAVVTAELPAGGPLTDGPLTHREFVEMVAPTVCDPCCHSEDDPCPELGDHLCDDGVLRCTRHCTCGNTTQKAVLT